ncbi:MAG: hypothetical protein J6T11_00385, partial [Bacteroidaceae bacterium]|nr:hypothetical protein [Bacteroidaceae bacterium]
FMSLASYQLLHPAMLCYAIEKNVFFSFAGAKLVHFSDIAKRNRDFLWKKLWVCLFFLSFANVLPPES